MIQTNLPGTIYYTTDGSMPTKSSTSFSNEFTISKLTQLNIFSTSTNNKISSFNQYMTDSGTKTVNNYTYIIKIPNTPIKYIEIIKNANSTYATGYTLYDFNTKTITHPTSTNINKPGILIYTDNTGYIIKYYDYTYNNTNQVNAIFTKGIFGSERIHMKNNDQNNSIIIQITYGTSQIQKEEITTTFTSNLQDTITRHETIGYGLDYNSNYGFEILQTYLITNEMITQNIMQSWTNKTYSEGVEKARYGTFLTGLTTLWLNDETAQVYSKHLNLTIVKGRDTQLLVGIQNDGTSYINIPDPRLGITVVNTQSNITKTFTLITTLTVSECERIALRLSGQNITSTLAQIYQDYIYNNQNLIITFDNSTGQATLNTQNNNNSEIIIDMKTGIAKTIIKDNKNIYKGAISQPGTGYCYHSTRTDGLNDWINKIPTLNEYDQEMLYYLEDLGGGIFITARLLLACSGGSVIIGGLAVTLGIGMCFQAAGANSLDDVANPYCWAGAAPTLFASAIPFTSSLRITAKSIIAGTRISTNIGLKSTIIISAGEESIKRYDKQLESYITGSVISENLKSALRYLKVPGEENLRKVMVYG